MILSRRGTSSSLWADIAVVWGGFFLTMFVTDLVRRAPIASFHDAVFTHVYPLSVALCFLALTAAALARSSWEDVWRGLIDASPVAFLLATIVGSIGPWNDGSGAIALAPMDAVMFVVTGGVLPVSVGPIVLARVFLLAYAGMTGLIASRRGFATPRCVLVAVASWIAACIPLLAQSWIALGAAIARRLPLEHSLDALRALGAAVTHSYWSNAQADRFFSGIGDQVEIAAALSGAALCLVLLAAAIKGRHFRTVVSWMRVYPRRTMPLVFSPLLAGFLMGIRGTRLSWTGLDALSIVLMFCMAFAWFVWDRWGTEQKEIGEAASLFAFASGGVMGWPVVALLVALFASGYGRMRSMRVLRAAISAGFLVAIGGAVAVRSAVFPPALFDTALFWGVLTAVVVGWEKKIDSWLRYGVILAIGMGWAVTFLRFSLPS